MAGHNEHQRHHNHRHRTQPHLHSNKRVQQPQAQPQPQPQPQRPTTPPSPDILMLDGNEATYLLDLQLRERESTSTPANEDFTSRLGSENPSFVDVDTIRSSSVAETKNTGSYVLVQGVGIGPRQTTYVDEMMEEAMSDGKSYSTPSEGEEWEWAPPSLAGNEVVMDVVPGSQVDVLHGLSTPYPQQVFNGYEGSAVSTSEDDVEYQESTDYYALNASPQPGLYSMEPDQLIPRTFVVPSGPYPQDSADSPWNPVKANRTQYDHGFAAFMPSPGPVGKQTVEEILQGTPKTRQVARVNHKNDRSGSHSHSRALKSSSKGKEKATEPGWEHTVVKKDGLGRLVSDEEEKRRGPPGRKGKLDPETRKKARKMRQIKSCWRCWNLKITCSEGEHCTPCLKRYSSLSPTSDQLCCRTGFDEYEPAFFPEFLNAHLKKSQVVELISKSTTGFWDVTMEVEVTTGVLFKPMRLPANLFGPKGFDLLVHHQLATDAEDSDSQLVCRYSAPLGLMGIDMSDLIEICRQHIEDMIVNPEYPLQATAGDPTYVPQSILEIVQQYCISKKSPLVRNAMMLHAINYSMSRLVTFSAESAMRIAETLRQFPYIASDEPFISSRLLNRQIKYALHKLHREITKDVLEGLEKSMRSKSRDSWGPSLCAVLVLSLCIENLQIAADTFVVCDMEKDPASQHSRRDSIGACEVLEKYPYQRCTRLFHDIYRSHKQPSGKVKDGAFNPIQFEYVVDASAGWDDTTNKMAIAVRGLIDNSYDELACLSERSQFVNFGNASLIRTNNTGRLASKFLLTFLNFAA